MKLLIPVRIDEGRAVPSGRFCKLLRKRQMSDDAVWYFFNISTNPDVPMLYAWREDHIKELNPTMSDETKQPEVDETHDQPWPEISKDAIGTLAWIMENNPSTLTYKIGGGGTPAGAVDLLSGGYMERTENSRVCKVTDSGLQLWQTLNKDLTYQRVAVRFSGQIVVVDVVKMLTVNTFTATIPAGNDTLEMEYSRDQIIEAVPPSEMDAWLGAWSAANRADDERREHEAAKRQREAEEAQNRAFGEALTKALAHLGIAVKAGSDSVSLPTGHRIEMATAYREKGTPSYFAQQWQGQQVASFKLNISKPVPGSAQALEEDLPRSGFNSEPVKETIYAILGVDKQPINGDWSAIIGEFASLLTEVDRDVQKEIEEIAKRRALKGERDTAIPKPLPAPEKDESPAPKQADDTRFIHFESWKPEDAARATREISDLRKQGFEFFASGDGYVILTRDEELEPLKLDVPFMRRIAEGATPDDDTDDEPVLDRVWETALVGIEGDADSLGDRLVREGQLTNVVKALTSYAFKKSIQDPAYKHIRHQITDAKSTLVSLASDIEYTSRTVRS